MSKRYTTVIFDLGDVLFTWSLSASKSILPAKTLGSILRSVHWFEYEKGNLTEDEVYSLVAQEFSVSAIDVKSTLEAARSTLQSDPKILEIIRELKESGLSVYAMSNISAPDWELLSAKATPEEWALFDYIFTSSAVHQRKPNIGFYKHVIQETGIDPSRAIFVDDKLENVITARSFGMHGIIFDDQAKVIRQLKNLCGDPISRGNKFLASRKQFTSVTDNNIEFSENFCELLILDATGDKSLVEFVEHQGKFNFFKKAGTLRSELYPDDFDTTAFGLTVTDQVDMATKHKIMDEMLEYRDSDGIIQVYFDHSRPRIDPICCVNILCLFYANGRGGELHETFDWVTKVLENRAYISGTYYYVGGDLFLFFLSRLLQSSSEVRQRLGPTFKERIMERFGREADSVSLAARILAAIAVDIVDHRDLETLLSMQREDGSWGDSWIYKAPGTAMRIRNDSVTTALSIHAIRQVEKVTQINTQTLTKQINGPLYLPKFINDLGKKVSEFWVSGNLNNVKIL
ncbi:HAD-like protein [Phlegmacium glaucopus]|nr:HAD-like protein [Phlegmacium glaucopus]